MSVCQSGRFSEANFVRDVHDRYDRAWLAYCLNATLDCVRAKWDWPNSMIPVALRSQKAYN